jgi:DNA-binding NtrC family response regulator
LNVVPVEIPPLRKRREDIPALVAFFLNHYSAVNERYVVHIQHEAMQALQDYHWPGNVRELQNYVERAVVMAEGDELTIEHLPSYVVRADRKPIMSSMRAMDLETLTAEVVAEGIRSAPPDADDLHRRVVDRVEKELIIQVLSQCNQVQTKTASKLGINRNTLHKKLKDYGLDEQAASE